MCTVTIVPSGDGFCLGCNRDERRDRAVALPPTVHSLRQQTAIFQVDPAGQGTWVGVNGAGVAACFHSHQWPSRRDISVSMERADATTVSQMVVNGSFRAIEPRYRALESAKPVAVTAA